MKKVLGLDIGTNSIGWAFIKTNAYETPETLDGKILQLGSQQKILDEGYGYKTWIKDFREKLNKKGIDEKKAVEFLEPHLMNDYSTMGEKIRELLNNR